MSEKVTRKHADILREASGQISGLSYEPLSGKCLYKGIVPEMMAQTPKSIESPLKVH